MLRVSSRQRLVSWDVFDATEHNLDHTTEDEEDQEDALSFSSLDDDGSSDYQTCYDIICSPSSNSGNANNGLTNNNITTTFTPIKTTSMLLHGRRVDSGLSLASTAYQDAVVVAPAEAEAWTTASSATILKRKRNSSGNLRSKQEPAVALPMNNSEGKLPLLAIMTPLKCQWDMVPITSSYSGNTSRTLALLSSSPMTSSLPRPASSPALISPYEDVKMCKSRLVSSHSAAPKSPLERLPQDVALHIMSFLTASQVGQVAQACRAQRSMLVQSPEATALWNEMAQRQWPHYTLDTPSRDLWQGCPTQKNLHRHLQLAPVGTTPTCLDETMFPRLRIPNFAFMGGRLRPPPAVPAAAPGAKEFAMVPAPTNGLPALQFVGRVGMGDRCARANHPLLRPRVDAKQRQQSRLSRRFSPLHRRLPWNLRPRPAQHDDDSRQSSRSSNGSVGSSSSASSSSSSSRRGFKMPLGWRRHGHSSTPRAQGKPFCAPLLVRDDNGQTVWDVTPRLFSYFEVSIIAAPTSDAQPVRPRPLVRIDDDVPMPMQRNVSECIAVGLGADNFAVHARMPGWDDRSYGYHGDDGGIFHGGGHMQRRYGPTFGVGDTVGCGVDYQARAIFFTRNGTFLGYAWENLDASVLERDLYPVVGVDDSHCLVQCNFGTDSALGPFQYNPTHLLQQHANVVHAALRPKSRRRRKRHVAH